MIELLVVIAIIGILSSVVLTSLNTARGRGNDAKVKAQLASLRSAAELYYDTNASYGAAAGSEAANTKIGTGCDTSMFTDPLLDPYTLATNYPATAAGTGKCTASAAAYAVSSRLNAAGTFWCVDSSGISKQTAALQANSVYTCP